MEDIGATAIDTFVKRLRDGTLRLYVVGEDPETSREALLSVALGYESQLY